MYGVALEKVNADINAQGTTLTPILNNVGMMFLIRVHKGIGFRTEQGTLLAIILTALIVYHLGYIVHACLLKEIVWSY